MRLKDRDEARMCHGYERASENLYQIRARRNNRKFSNEPKNSGDDSQNDRSHDQLRQESGAAAIRVPRQEPPKDEPKAETPNAKAAENVSVRNRLRI
jgi:hypothetical protein